MEDTSSQEFGRKGTFPTRAFLAVVALVCLGLAMSAGYDFFRLADLRTNYLRSNAERTAATLDALARGPDRSNPAFWQKLFSQSMNSADSSVAFLAYVDDSDRVLAGEGERFASVFAGPSGIVRAADSELFVIDYPLIMQGRGQGQGPRRGGGGGGFPRESGRSIRVGIYTDGADFIRWEAAVDLAINGAAIVTLVALSFYFLRTLNRFLQLQAREASARHLMALGGMAATLAHEIRNPLGAMKGLTQLVQEDLPDDHKTQSLMNTVVCEAERLEQLVTDLLTFARPREPQISGFDARWLLADGIASLQPRLEEGRIRLYMSPEPAELAVDSDEAGLRQILLNVLLNAIDATPPDGTIRIHLRYNGKTGMWGLEIDDSGGGLGNRDPEEFFTPFTTTKTKGTGLGLPISRQIAERLGGSLQLAGRPEGGARCTLLLPIHADAGKHA